MESDPIDIYTPDDINSILENGIICGDIIIRGENLKQLHGVIKINGSFGISDSNIESLGELKEISGDFWTSFYNVNSPLKSLNNLEIIKGDVTLRYSNVADLGELKHVGGRLSLRDTKIENLGKLKFVGGDLFLPKRLKDEIDLSNIKVLGNIKFWNDVNITSKPSMYPSDFVIKDLESRGDFESVWRHKYENGFVFVQTIWEYEQKLRRSLLDGKLIAELAGCSHLTDFGRNNIDSIKPIVIDYLSVYESKHNSTFFDLFFDHGKLHKDSNNEYDPFYYKRFYNKEEEFYFYKKIDDDQQSMYNPEVIRHVVEKAILNQFRYILKESEDLYREKIGMPKIGEGWISETELFYKLADRFKELEVLHHGKPKWIGRQHFDIYFPELNIAIEYQGQQHYQPIDYFGGEEAFKKNQERDENKRKLCMENNCILIYVEENYVFEELVLFIEKSIEIRN